MENKALYEGAEAKIFEIDSNILKKIRLSKKYRLEQIDFKLRKFRNKREFKVLNKLYEQNVNVPKPISIDEKEIFFLMEKINGDILKEVLTKNLLYNAFEEIIKVHKLNIVHGDLTTLNMIEKDNEIYIIDFGLSDFSQKVEDKAVDLNLFFTCIKNEHSNFYKYKEELSIKYSKEVEKGNLIIERLKKIEHRGRNK